MANAGQLNQGLNRRVSDLAFRPIQSLSLFSTMCGVVRTLWRRFRPLKLKPIKGFAALFACLYFSALAQAATPPVVIVPGQFNVGATGASSYQIPIVVPPGTSGLTPTLSLNYSSQNGNGLAGLGWSLGGLPEIGRCPRTLAQDSVHGGVNYDANDRFCMNGQRLVLISGTYGADGSQYRTEIESFSKIVAHGSAGSGPAWFEVRTKAGQIMEFGNTADSRVLVVNAVTGVTSTARAWALNKLSDAVGNYLAVTYNCAAIAGACTDTSRTTYGQAYPLRIDYTGNAAAGVSPYNSVQFSYTSRSDTSPVYQAGGITQTTVLLTNIKTYQSTNPVSDYQLGYRTGTSTLRSRLVSVSLCDGGIPQQCLNPTTFGWQGGVGYLAMAASSPISAAQGGQILPGDFNGDGLLDMITVNPNACSPYNVYVGTPSMGLDPAIWGTLTTPADGAPSCTVTPVAQALTGPNSIPYILLPITAHRVGGDENDGVLISSHAANFQVQSFPFTTSSAPKFPGDYNGDGLIDFLMQQSPTTYAWLGDGSGGFTQDGGHSGLDPTNTIISPADFDGDGCTDILALPTGAGGGNAVTYFCNPAAASVTPPSTVGYNITLGDFNADGKTDILLTSTSAAGKLYFSTGTDFILSSCSIPSGWGNYRIATSNWDGDGRADLLLVQPASGGTPGTSQLWVSTGGCFTQAVDSGNNPITIATLTSTPNAALADWNNDGVVDIWMQESFNNGSSTPATDRLYTFNYSPELMTSVSNGIGAATNVTYDRLNKNGGLYEKGSSASFPNIDVDGAMYVVSRVDLSNGLGTCTPSSNYTNCYSSTYAYTGGRTNLWGRGFLGFSQVSVTDLQTHIVQKTSYNLAFPYIGLVASQTRRYIGHANDLSSLANTYTFNSGCGTTPSTGVYFVCQTQTIAAGYDLNDTAAFPTTTTDYTYDSYGNALTVDVSVSDGSTKNTTNTYSNDTTNWFLGRLLTTSAQSIVGSSNITRQSSFAYDSSTGLLIQEIIEPGVSTCNSGSDSCTLTTAYTYDLFGHRVTSQVSGTGIATRTSYAVYDSLGQFQTHAINALGQYETWLRDPRFGDPISQTGPNGLTTTWAYDTFGRQTLEIRPDGTKTAVSYSYCSGSCPANGAYSAQSQMIGADGSTQIGPASTTTFDMLSRLIAADSQGFDGSNVRVATLYDANGRVAQTSRPYFTASGTPKFTTLTYDALGRVTQTLAPNSSITSYGYNGLVTTVTNGLGQTVTTTKNAQGLNASVQDAAGKTTSYVYNSFGDLLTVTDPAGNVITNSYDVRGNKIQMVDPDMGTWTYVHSVAGELTSQTDAKSQTTSLTYDLLNRPLTRTESGLYSSWTYGTSSAFRNVGKLIDAKSCTTSSCTTLVADRTFSYDDLGRPAATVLQTAGNSYGYRATYNAMNGALSSVTYPSGFLLGYSYNTYGYLCVLAEDGGNFGCNRTGTNRVIQTVNARDAEGHLTQSTAGNGVVTNRTFDPNSGFLTMVRAGTSGAVASFDYTFDAIGNLTARTDHNQNFTEGFCYDTLNRLTNYSRDAVGTATWGSENWGAFVWGAPCGKVSVSNWGSVNWGGFVWGATCVAANCKTVSYDSGGLGNIVGKSDVGTYSYPSAGAARPHAVSSITGTVDGLTDPIYTYDGNGNMICMSTGASCTGTVGRQVTLTAFNMADTITKGTTSIAFTYDGEHQRIRQVATVAGTATTTTYLNDSASGASSQLVTVGSGTPTWTDYVKLDGQIVAQRTSTYTTPTWGGVNWGSFVWGAPVSASNWGAHNWGSFNWAASTSSSWAYFTLDHLGSIAVITDATAAVTQRLSYDAWGKQRNADGTDVSCGTITSSTTRGFTNEEQIPLACMVNLNARIYDPTLGRFMAPDSVVPAPFDGQSFNRYAYVNNRPLSFIDPTGYSLCGLFGYETYWDCGIGGFGGGGYSIILVGNGVDSGSGSITYVGNDVFVHDIAGGGLQSGLGLVDLGNLTGSLPGGWVGAGDSGGGGGSGLDTITGTNESNDTNTPAAKTSTDQSANSNAANSQPAPAGTDFSRWNNGDCALYGCGPPKSTDWSGVQNAWDRARNAAQPVGDEIRSATNSPTGRLVVDGVVGLGKSMQDAGVGAMKWGVTGAIAGAVVAGPEGAVPGIALAAAGAVSYNLGQYVSALGAFLQAMQQDSQGPIDRWIPDALGPPTPLFKP